MEMRKKECLPVCCKKETVPEKGYLSFKKIREEKQKEEERKKGHLKKKERRT